MFPLQFSLTFDGIKNPTFVSNFYGFTNVKTYSSSYLVDEDVSTIQFATKCTFPCK